MKRVSLFLLAALAGCAAGGGAGAGPATQRDETAEMSARLAGATFGRVPGQPVSCIPLTEVSGNRALGPELVLFDGDNRRQWVSRVQNCAGLRYGRALRVISPTGRLCRGDTVQLFDPRTNTASGRCTMGDFLTYEPRR